MPIFVITGVIVVVVLAIGVFVLAGNSEQTLRIATTTSLDDSGLLDDILPDFESEHDATTEVIAVGTGQALVLGERGDVDVVLVHAPGLEREFVDNGYGVDRTTVMTNPFIIVGPSDDPAGVADAENAGDALVRIAEAESPFVSRGDDSGTHTKELEIWATTNIQPATADSWYHAAGQGMGETLLTANELIAYTLTDRATFVTIDDNQVADLVPLYGAPDGPGAGDALLDNPYSVIAVNPDLHPDVASDLAQAFIEWFNSESTRTKIAEYGTDTYGESLFTLLGDG
jgi:tungstate transport system substrate-binding protein